MVYSSLPAPQGTKETGASFSVRRSGPPILPHGTKPKPHSIRTSTVHGETHSSGSVGSPGLGVGSLGLLGLLLPLLPPTDTSGVRSSRLSLSSPPPPQAVSAVAATMPQQARIRRRRMA